MPKAEGVPIQVKEVVNAIGTATEGKLPLPDELFVVGEDALALGYSDGESLSAARGPSFGPSTPSKPLTPRNH